MKLNVRKKLNPGRTVVYLTEDISEVIYQLSYENRTSRSEVMVSHGILPEESLEPPKEDPSVATPEDREVLETIERLQDVPVNDWLDGDEEE